MAAHPGKQGPGTHTSTAPARSSADATECGWCGTPLDASGKRRRRRTLCGRCGAWTTDPAPTGDELDRAYGGSYRPPGGRFAGPGDALLRVARGRLARRLDRIAPPGAILDVGAGDGALLDALRARGRRVLGLERGASSRPDVRELDLAEVDGRWAGIVFWHSLEHLPRAGAALDRAASILASQGVLVIALPNPGSLQAALFGDRWLALDLPRHLVHVPAPVLVARLESSGLQVERVSYLRGGQLVFGWLHGLVALLPGRPDLYGAIRRPEARSEPLSRGSRALALTAAAILLPAAVAGAATEAALRRGGTTYLEARRV